MIEVKVVKVAIDVNSKMPVIVLRNRGGEKTFLIRRKKESVQIDSRPSDAIALALRLRVPIFIDETVLNEVAVGDEPMRDEEVEDFKKKLEELKPEDFTG